MTNHDDARPAVFDVTRDGEVVTLAVGGEIDVATSPELRRELAAVLDEQPSTTIVDLASTTFIDSSGLGVLVGALKRVRESDHGQELVLRGLQDPVRKVFEITGLTELFELRA